jgi:hypothetical protein
MRHIIELFVFMPVLVAVTAQFVFYRLKSAHNLLPPLCFLFVLMVVSPVHKTHEEEHDYRHDK